MHSYNSCNSEGYWLENTYFQKKMQGESDSFMAHYGKQVDTMQFWRSVVKCDCLSC